MRLLHLVRAVDWAGARRAGRLPATQGAGGLLHACTTSQLPGVLARARVGREAAGGPGASLVLLVLDVTACEAAGAVIVWAAADRADGPFPHVHGAVPVGAVVLALVIVPGPDGAPGEPDRALLTGLAVLDAPPSGEPVT